MGNRTTCPRCHRDVAIIGKHGQLARHKCEPTAAYALREAADAEATARNRLVACWAEQASARAWTFRLSAVAAAIVAVNTAATLVLAHGPNLKLAALGLLIALFGIASSLLRWREATAQAATLRAAHGRAFAALEDAQAAVGEDDQSE